MKKMKKLLAMLLAFVMVVGAVNLPQKADTANAAATKQGTLSKGAGGYHCQTGSNRWLLYLDIGKDSGGNDLTLGGDIYWSNNTVYIDGVAHSGEGVNYTRDLTNNDLMLCLTFAHSPQGETHTLLIPKGTVIGDIEVQEDFALVLGSDNGVYEPTLVRLMYTGGGAQDDGLGSRYALHFKVPQIEVMGDNYWTGCTNTGYATFDNTVYVGDSKVSGDGVNYVGSKTDNTLSLYLQYGKIKDGVTKNADLDPFTLNIPWGTLLGNTPTKYLVTTKAVQLDINKDTITEVMTPDKTVTLSNDAGRNQGGNCTGGFYFYTSEDDGLTADSSWATRYSMSTGGIYVNDSVVSGAKLVKILSNLYYVAFDGCGITFKAGDTVKIDGMVNSNGHVVKYEAQTFEYDGSGNWDIYVPKTSYTPTFGKNSSINGFSIVNEDSMPYDGTWATCHYTAADDAESGVFVDGTKVANIVLKKYAGNEYFVAVDGKATVKRGTVLELKGTFAYETNSINFDSTKYHWDGTQWLAGDTLDTDFAITGLGTCEYDGVGGWKLRFTTDSVIAGDDFATNLGEYTIQVNESDITAYATSATGYGLGLLVDGLGSEPQGTVLTIPAGTIGDYTLENSYTIVYDDGWQLYTAPTDVTIYYATYNTGVANGSLVYPITQANGIAFADNQEWVGAYGTSGIFVNGRKVEDAKLIVYAGGTHFYLQKSTLFAADVAEDDIITVKGVFKNGETYVNFGEHSARFNGTTWVQSHSYENFHKITITGYVSGGPQDQDAAGTELNRWLFRVRTSTPLENGTGDFAPYLGTIPITVTDKDGETKDANVDAYMALDSASGVVNLLGFIIPYATLPKDATGYTVTIHSCIFSTKNKTYRITEDAVILAQPGDIWAVQTDRPISKGVVGDANGDGVFNSADLVSTIKELKKVEGYLCTEDALFAGKTVVTEYDMIHVRERLLDAASDGSSYVPVYLDDEDIELAAYKGPRTMDRDWRYDDNGNLLSGYTQKSFLTDTEFARYAAAGLNTLIAEADAPFSSENSTMMGSGGGHWANIESYLTMAANHGLDVYLASDAVNAYLRGNTVTSSDGLNREITVTDDFMEADLTQLLTGVGSATHGGNVTQSNPTGKLVGALDYDNFKGLMLSDEIRYNSLGYYTTVNNFLRKVAPDIEVLTSFEKEGTAVGADYSTFAKEYANASLNNMFAYDYYPIKGQAEKSFNWSSFRNEYKFDNVTATMSNDWVTKLENLAGYALNGGFDTGITVTSSGMLNYANGEKFGAPTAKEDIGFMVYTSLAYGMKNIRYYTYWEHDVQAFNENTGEKGTGKYGEVYTNSMVTVDASGNVTETDIYRAVQAVNREILQFDHVFLDYDWRSTIKINPNDQLSGLTNGSSTRIASYSSTNAAIIGCMKDTEKNLDGFWLVNATEPEEAKANQITVKFNDAAKALIYNPATGEYGKLVNLTDGTYTANLASGAGQFIIPLK